jgi:hypothetical protein
MRKIAIFVEGQTELIFVREFLLKIFDYQNVSLECYTLFNDSSLIPAEYDFPNENAEHHFQIMNIGNDKSVLSRMLNREQHMRNAGFERLIGLRDLYSKEYREKVQDHSINLEIIDKFKNGYRNQISSDTVFFNFAIMEIESWILGFHNIFERIDEALTVSRIEASLGYNLETIDPELTFFHPSKNIEDIFSLAGKPPYGKSKEDVNAIVSHISKEDYNYLLNSSKCNSFKEFYESLNITFEEIEL